jgi:hypothetical protein
MRGGVYKGGGYKGEVYPTSFSLSTLQPSHCIIASSSLNLLQLSHAPLTYYLHASYMRLCLSQVHVSQGQQCPDYEDPNTGEPINFNFLPQFAVPYEYSSTLAH